MEIIKMKIIIKSDIARQKKILNTLNDKRTLEKAAKGAIKLQRDLAGLNK